MSEVVVILQIPADRMGALYESGFGESVLFFALASEERIDHIVGEAASITEAVR